MTKNSKSKKVDIKKKPTQAVSGLQVPARQVSSKNFVMSSSWKYPKKCFDEKEADRFQGVRIRWTLDEDPSSTKVSNTKKEVKLPDTTAKKKNNSQTKSTTTAKISVATFTGASKTEIYWNTKSGSDATDISRTFARSGYYPKYTTVKTVKIYKVTKAKYVSKTKKWTISGKYAKAMTLAQLNAAVKKGTVVSRAALQARSSSSKLVGKLYYISKTNKKYTGTKRVYKPKLYGVGIAVQGWNVKSSSKDGKATTKKNVVWDGKVPSQAAYRSFAVPDPPKITRSVAGEASSHTITFKVDASADDGTISKERYDTVYTLSKITGFYNSAKKWTSTKKEVDISGMTNKSEVKKTFEIKRNPNTDMPSKRTLLSLAKNEYIRYHLKIYNRGFAGDGKMTEAGKNSGYTWFTYAWPDSPSIKSIEEKSGRCVIKFERTSTSHIRYTTKYTLQRLANYRPAGTGVERPVDDWSDTQWINAARNDNGWTDVYSIGPGELKKNIGYFTDAAYAHKTDPFKRTYYRVKASNDIYGIDDEYSAPTVVPGFFKIPSAANEKSKFLSLTAIENGLALKAIVAFKKTKTSQGIVQSNGTELSWDTASYAWKSTTAPSSYDFKDTVVKPVLVTQARKDAKKVLKKAPLNWMYATYYIRGITQNESYYVKARRFLKDTEYRESDSYGPYAAYSVAGAVATVKAASVPKDVKLSVPERLISGKDLSVSWTYESDEIQKSYELMWLQGTSKSAIAAAKSLATATESAPYCVVKWSTLSNKVFKGHLYLAVRVTTESGTSNLSSVQTVSVYSPPTASLSCASTVTSQPVVLTLGTNDPAAAAVVRITSNQVIDWGPAGPDNQAEGAIIYTNKFVPAWKKQTTNGKVSYYANHSVPYCDLRDNGKYTVEYTAVVDDTGLDSDTVDAEGDVVRKSKVFTVNYPESVVVPNFYVVVDPLKEDHGGAARISIANAASNKNCVADLYRVTPDGVHLLYGNLTKWQNVTLTDPYPPYSRHEPCVYRLAIRSQNGVREWGDRSYAFPGYSVRFDWGEKESEAKGTYTHLTLPYNLKWSDSWTKNSRVELHLDGTYGGYWRKGVDHKNTLNTELVKLTGAEQIARVIALANHSGPVLVRLPNGREFAADVQVSNLDVSYDALTVTASFSAQEIRMPAKFTASAVTVSSGLYVPKTT